MANLSDRNGKVRAVETPQSPGKAGEIKQYGGASAPSGYLECSGQAVSRTDFSQLFTNIGTKYGVGDGSTTFNLPDGPRKSHTVSNLSFSNTPAGWGLTNSYGHCEQDSLGQWWLHLNIVGFTDNGTDRSIDIDGVVWDTANIAMASYQSSKAGSAQAQNTNTIRVVTSTNDNGFRVSGKIPLASKPTDAFVGASSFSTFDEALESIPVIKLYDDSTEGATVGVAEATVDTAGTVKLSSDFAATSSQYGLTLKPVIEEVILTSDTNLTSVDTWTDVIGASLALSNGVWLLCPQISGWFRITSGSPITGRINASITDNGNTVVPGTMMHQAISVDDNVDYNGWAYNPCVPVIVSTPTTYKIRIRMAGTNAQMYVSGASNQTSGFTDPDTELSFKAIKIY